MGCLRLLLASLVLASHIHLGPQHVGSIAVECFYAISGFYIQMILAERYANQAQWRRKFYESRALRIFIPYWATMLGIILLTFVFHPHAVIEHLPVLAHPSALSALANIFIVPSEHISLLRVAEGCAYPCFLQLIIPQIWSVGLELLFYLVAPWLLLMRTSLLVAATLLCLTAKGAFIYLHPDAPYAMECGIALLNNIFPLEMGIFMAGAVAYRFYLAQMRKDIGYKKTIFILSIITIAMLATYHNGNLAAWYGYVFCIVLLLPFLFQASRSLELDRLVGELSYPFYLCHYFLAHDLLAHIAGNRSIEKHPSLLYAKFLVLELATLLCSWIILKYIIEPLDSYRHRKFAAIPENPAVIAKNGEPADTISARQTS